MSSNSEKLATQLELLRLYTPHGASFPAVRYGYSVHPMAITTFRGGSQLRGNGRISLNSAGRREV
jgi:hypothetical protein